LSSDGSETLSELTALNDLARSADDVAYVESQLNAVELADRETSRQKSTLNQLTQQSAAWLIAVSSKHLRDEGVARNADSTYNGPDLVQWLVDRQISKARKEWERDSDTLKNAAERQAEAKAIKYEEQAKGLQDQYVLRADVLQEFEAMASEVRREMENVSKLMAPDFPEERRDSLVKELDNHLRQVLRRLAAKGRVIA